MLMLSDRLPQRLHSTAQLMKSPDASSSQTRIIEDSFAQGSSDDSAIDRQEIGMCLDQHGVSRHSGEGT